MTHGQYKVLRGVSRTTYARSAFSRAAPEDGYRSRVGFSPLGFVVSVFVLAPTLLLAPFPPRGPAPPLQLPPALAWTERVGQALCVVVPAATAPGEIVWWWALPGIAALLGYHALWVRYLATGRRRAALYDTVWRVPVPMAVLPVVVFLATAGLLSNPSIAVAAVVLAAGHIPASLSAARALAHRS